MKRFMAVIIWAQENGVDEMIDYATITALAGATAATFVAAILMI